MNVYRYDAFSNQPNKGNPAGVVFEADALSDMDMQNIASAVGFNETAFLCESHNADIQLRYFTPGHEMNLCGHGTVASLAALYQLQGRKQINTVETNAGILKTNIEVSPNGEVMIFMKQRPAEFIDFDGDIEQLAAALGIAEHEIEHHLPIVYGNTGIWTLLVPIKTLDTFTRMSPNNHAFPDILSLFRRSSIHPFCLETYHHNTTMHGRHFSSPYSGTIEDPVTGTASGVMGAYYLKYLSDNDSISFIIEQGQEINKNGYVTVNAMKSGNQIEVEIAGTATFVEVLNVDDSILENFGAGTVKKT